VARRDVLLALAIMLAMSGCGGWHRQPVGELERVRPDAVVEVWRGRQRLELKGIRLTADSISGIPFIRRLDCDSCRLTIPRAEVDSIREGGSTFEGPMAVLIVGFFGGMLLLWFALCGLDGCDYGT
jgi:hypothetical protein